MTTTDDDDDDNCDDDVMMMMTTTTMIMMTMTGDHDLVLEYNKTRQCDATRFSITPGNCYEYLQLRKTVAAKRVTAW
jgi:hypothetical protein